MLAASPVELSSVVPGGVHPSPEAAAAAEYTVVQVRGRLRHDRAMLLGPRGMPVGMSAAGHSNKTGFYVIVPLERSDGGPPVLVNRGWVPAGKGTAGGDAVLAMCEQPSGEVVITGVLRMGEPEPTWMPANNAAANQWYWLDLKAMEAASAAPVPAAPAAAAPLYLELLAPSAAGRASAAAYPLAKDSASFMHFHTGLEKHVAYAVTWYMLACAGLGITFVRFRRRPPPSAFAAAAKAPTARQPPKL
jgi:surfeit locus 1 family protein